MKDFRVNVIADDLTGALDTGVQFRKYGLSVQIYLSENSLFENTVCKNDAAVRVFNTESRDGSSLTAKKKIKQIFRNHHFQNNCLFYKKIDSTLRGNIGFELETLMNEVESNLCFFAPAYPDQNRTTLNGIHRVDGIKVGDTEYSSEMKFADSTLTSLIETQTNRKTDHVKLETIRKGSKTLREHIENLVRNGVKIISFDAVRNEDLFEIVQVSQGVKVLCGSAGLASQIPIGLRLVDTKPVLTVSGSPRTITLKQIEALVNQTDTKSLCLSTLKILQKTEARAEEIKRIALTAVESLVEGCDVVISSISGPNSFKSTIDLGKKLGLSANDVRTVVSETLSLIVSEILSQAEISGLILTGGDTAMAIYDEIGVNRVELIEEFLPGIPLLKIPTGLMSITKAGGFGAENTIIKAVNFLKRRSLWNDQ